MADSGGHWLNLAEVQRLTQSVLLPGVMDEAPKRGGLLDFLPIRQQPGLSLKWNRSNARRSATRIAIGSQLTWTDNVTYTPVESELKIFYDQTPLNKFVRDVYDNINNYEAQQMLELRTGIIETIEDALIYDDDDYNSLHIEGLHHWAVDQTGTDGDIDEGEGALSFINLRVGQDFMKHGMDFYLMPFGLVRFISQFYQEGGSVLSGIQHTGSFAWQPTETGVPMPWWAGTPIRRSDYMVAEQANTGVGSDARAKNTSGTEQFSIFGIKRGAPGMMNDPGVNVGFGGNDREAGEVFRPERFDKLEDFDAAGMRVVSYIGQTLGSSLGLSRIFDVTNAMPTA